MNDHRAQRSLATEKRKLRESMQARRMAMPHAAMLSASQSVARQFADHPILAFAPSFAGYRAMRGELDVMEIFNVMARFEKVTSLPCVTAEKSLLFRAWSIGDALTRHALGMEEPLADATEITPTIILVPLLAFDGEGYRLGYGGGFYDRTIAAARSCDTANQTAPPEQTSAPTLTLPRGGREKCLFIGTGFSMQEVDQVPTDEHDQPLDGVLTELGVSMF